MLCSKMDINYNAANSAIGVNITKCSNKCYKMILNRYVLHRITYNLSRVDVCSGFRLTISAPLGLEREILLHFS